MLARTRSKGLEMLTMVLLHLCLASMCVDSNMLFVRIFLIDLIRMESNRIDHFVRCQSLLF